jgi:RNA-directed DNA polymerase
LPSVWLNVAQLIGKIPAISRFTLQGLLLFTFRQRKIKEPKTDEIFLGFTPGASDVALKSIRRKIKAWWIGRRTDLGLDEIAVFSKPFLQGWWNYYGRYYRSLLYRISRYFNQRLVRWAMRKYRHLHGRKMRAIAVFDRLAKVRPNLFAHWAQGMTGGFA